MRVSFENVLHFLCNWCIVTNFLLCCVIQSGVATATSGRSATPTTKARADRGGGAGAGVLVSGSNGNGNCDNRKADARTSIGSVGSTTSCQTQRSSAPVSSEREKSLSLASALLFERTFDC